tara:strand:+ start:29 stop:268 length:240 start_codon:yes stop_codon:yes gene_type:complete
MKYKFKYKKGLFWTSVMITGHMLTRELDRMDIFLEDGSLRSIANWSKYDLRLGVDWVASTKKLMEEESGQEVKLNVKEA